MTHLINNWQTKKLGEVACCQDGDWILSQNMQKGGDVRLIQLGDIGDGEFLNKTSKYITSSKCRELKCTFLQTGDILLARLGDPIGKSCIVPNLPYRAITAVDCSIIRGNERIVLQRYLLYVINSNLFRLQIAKYITGTTRKRISRKNLEKILVFVPPLPIQQAIVKELDVIRKLQELNNHQTSKLDELHKSLINEEIKSNKYSVAKLSEITKPQEFTNPEKSPNDDYQYVDISAIDSENSAVDLNRIKQFKGKDAPSRARKKIEVGDVLFSTVRPNLKRIAKVDFPTFNSLASTGFAVLRPDSNKVNPDYMGTITCSGIVTDQVLPQVRGAAYPAVSDDDIFNAEIPLPERKKQDEIAEKFTAIQECKKSLIKQGELFKELFESTLNKLMKGELVN